MLSDTSCLQLVLFFKIVLRYNYSKPLYMHVHCMYSVMYTFISALYHAVLYCNMTMVVSESTYIVPVTLNQFV